VGETLQDYKLLSFSRNKWIIMGNSNNEGNDQVDNKKTTTNNKIMQTQQRGK
jgi:hypothetical protein